MAGREAPRTRVGNLQRVHSVPAHVSPRSVTFAGTGGRSLVAAPTLSSYGANKIG